jgi:hypothetical protein
VPPRTQGGAAPRRGPAPSLPGGGGIAALGTSPAESSREGPVVFNVIYSRRGDYLIDNFEALGAVRGNHDPRTANATQGDSIGVP